MSALKIGSGGLAWIRSGNRDILFLDLKEVSASETLEVLDRFNEALRGRPERSVLVLVDVTGVGYDPSVSARWKASTLHAAAVLRGTAVYGMGEMVGLALRGFSEALRLLRRNQTADRIRLFSGRDDALAWLDAVA